MSWVVVFSHLRWNFVYQRPQHLLSRLAARGNKVLFVEEPVFGPSPACELSQPSESVYVCRPRIPIDGMPFGEAQVPILQRLIDNLMRSLAIERFVIWIYSPMAVRLARSLKGAHAVVYDCMDELSLFLNAPSDLVKNEQEVLEWADLVFTGGPSLYQVKKNLHPNVHCFPSSVDADHFRRGTESRRDPEDQAAFDHPRLGYFGVIDERVDLELLDYLCRHHPDWQIVMVGPVAKINPDDLPRHRNIHFLGQKDYDDLPDYLAGWDLGLLPFARNDATRFISPTKTLEYMAADKLIVSTPIKDVADLYSDAVYIADTSSEFLRACEHALGSSQIERARRVGKMRQVLTGTSWDRTVTEIGSLIGQALMQRSNRGQRERRPGSRTAARARKTHYRTIVIGAGPTGLSAAYHLGPDCLLLEQSNSVGGWCRSVESDGFTFDYAGHIMFTNSEYVHKLYRMLLGKNVHWQEREAWVFSKGVYTRYPFQGALYGLPADVIKECLVGAIEARFGPLKEDPKPPQTAGASTVCRLESAADCCADGVLESTSPLGVPGNESGRNGKPRNFEEFIYRYWGAGIAKHFAVPYNRKLWAVPLTDIETSWLGGRVPLPDLEEMIEGALRPVPKPMGPNARFGYPLKGGFQALVDGFLPRLRARLELDARVVKVRAKKQSITLSDGRAFTYDSLISTMPLPKLVLSLGPDAPLNVQVAARRLRHVSVRCVHLGVGRENLTEKHWIYYPEDTVFHRVFVQGNASPHCNPPGGFGLTCEITYSPSKPLPCEGDELIDLCIRDCRRVGLFTEKDPIWTALQVDLPHAYVVYDHGRAENVDLIRKWLVDHQIHLAGRYSEWEYYNSDHAFLAGKKVAENVRRLQTLADSAQSEVADELTG